ncbi:hypothetical protein [Cecembia calidifontis]|uniref:Uncharacterized protein n=1 Tax=Cecembia calidifontis TaxID=1187080 RepID=A0A4Q7PGU0_9BACT|nr:hypothetical protein [Cecembia calidifontis]RZS98122.1 hypothetical protein BC751_3756 [Cecembia calidifontis]
MFKKRYGLYSLMIFLLLGSCLSDAVDESNQDSSSTGDAVFLLIDEDSIDNGNEPNNFSDVDINDQIARIGLRDQLRYFKQNVGQRIDLYTGQVGDEGWFALTSIPNRWINAGPTNNGLRNYLAPGPGLGSPNVDDDREVLLDEIPNVIPLRATGLRMLVGQTVLSVVYDSDISINYSPIEGNLKGDNLGIVAFKVVDVRERTNGSSSSLPIVTVEIMDAELVIQRDLVLFSNVPRPRSSSEPFDIRPPGNVIAPEFIDAN